MQGKEILQEVAFALKEALSSQSALESVQKDFGLIPRWCNADGPYLPTWPNNCVLVAVEGWKKPTLGHYCPEDGKWYDLEFEYPYLKPVKWWMPLPKVPGEDREV